MLKIHKILVLFTFLSAILLTIIFSDFSPAYAVAENDSTPQLVLSAEKSSLYVSESEQDKTVTIYPALLNMSGQAINSRNIRYEIDQGQPFENNSMLTDFDAAKSVNNKGELTFALNKNLTADLFAETYGDSQTLTIYAEFTGRTAFGNLFAQINIEVKNFKDKLSIELKNNSYVAHEDNEICTAEKQLLRKGEAVKFSYSFPEKLSDSLSCGNSGSVIISRFNEEIRNGLKTVSVKLSALEVGDDVITVICGKLKIILPVEVVEADSVSVPEFFTGFPYCKTNGDVLVISEIDVTIGEIFKNLNTGNGVLTFNDAAENADRRISVSVEKNGIPIDFNKDIRFAEGTYLFTFSLPYESGVIWDGGGTASLTRTVILGAPLIEVTKNRPQIVFDGLEHRLTDFVDITLNGKTVAETEYLNFNGGSDMTDAGKYITALSLSTDNGFLVVDNQLTDGTAVIETEILKAEVSLKLSGSACYSGSIQNVDSASVKTEFSPGFPQNELSSAEISFIAGAEVVNAGEYSFTAANDDIAENTVQVKFNHKNYFLGKAEGVFTVKPAVIGPETNTGNEYDGKNHFAEAVSVSFNGVMPGETLTCGADYTVTVKSGDMPTETVENAGAYIVEIILFTKNYTFESGIKTTFGYTVSPKELKVSITAPSETYNGENLTPHRIEYLEAVFQGLADGDILSRLDVNIRGTAINAGIYYFSAEREGDNFLFVSLGESVKNYILTEANGTFEILPARLQISLNGKSVYNGKEVDLKKAEISLVLKNKSNIYSEIFGIYSLNFKALRPVKDYKAGGYSFGISDSADIGVYLKEGYSDNFTLESAEGVFAVEKSEILICGDYSVQREYGAPLSVKAPLSEYAGLAAEGVYDGDLTITIGYELPDGSVGKYTLDKLSPKAELAGGSAYNYTLSMKINSFIVEIVRAKIVGKRHGSTDIPAVSFFFVDSDGSEKPLAASSSFIYDGTAREVRAYGTTAYNDKIAMELGGGASFCVAGEYEFFAANPDINLYEYADGADYIKFTVAKRGISAEISASSEYDGSSKLPLEGNGLFVKFTGAAEVDGLCAADLIFGGGAISAGSHKIGLTDEEITVKLSERVLNNYTLENVMGEFIILPATIKITGGAVKPVSYTGDRVEAVISALSDGLSMQSFAKADGINVEFRLLTSSGRTGNYFYPDSSDNSLQVAYSVSVPGEKSENYSKTDGGDFNVDFSEAVFTVKIVMAEIVSVNWFLECKGNVIPLTGELEFDANLYYIFVEGKFKDENGILRPLGKDEISVSLHGLTSEDEKRLVYAGDRAALRNAGSYYASIDSDIYAVRDGLKSVAITVNPYKIELKAHAPSEEGDLLYGGSGLKGLDGGTVTLGEGAFSETVRAAYSLDVSKTKDGKGVKLNADGFASADTYYGLMPFDIILTSDSAAFCLANYVCACPNDYALRIAPVTVRTERAEYSADYAGFMGEAGIYTAERLARMAAITFSENQAGGLTVSGGLKLPSFGVKFSDGDLSEYGGVQAAVNAGEYSFSIVLESADFCFADGTDTLSFIIKPAEISVSLKNSESYYCAEDFAGCLRLKFFSGGQDVSFCFYDGTGNVIKVSKDGIFGVDNGAPTFGLNFFTDSNSLATSQVSQLKSAGTYCVKADFCEYISKNFILDRASENLVFTIKPSEVSLEADDLDFTENSNPEIFPGLRDYLMYDKNAKEIVISTAAEKEGASNGKYFIPMFRIFGEIKGFYGEKDFSALTLSLETPAEAAAYTVSVSVEHSSNYNVTCPIVSALIQVTPRAADVEWRFNGGAVEDDAVLTFNGNDRLGEFSAAATGADGEKIVLSSPLSALIKKGDRFTDVGLLNAGVYELSVTTENPNYTLFRNTIKIEIAPRTVTAEELLAALVWRNSSNGNSLLQDGSYNVGGFETVNAVNSFVGYKGGINNTIVMGESPETCGYPAFTVKYTGNEGGDIGSYSLKASLALGGNLRGELYFVNFAWESGLYANLRGGNEKDYGETVSYNESSGCIEVTKKWYVVILNNGLANGLDLPHIDCGGDSSGSNSCGWTFGKAPYIYGYPSPVRENAVMYVSFGRVSDEGDGLAAGKTFSEDVWLNNFEIARICVAYSPENKYSSDCKIINFIDFWLNAAAPSGNYAIIVYIAEEESGGEIYAPCFAFWSFSVLPAPLSFTGNPIGNFEAEYDGAPHFFKDGIMPEFDNLSDAEIETIRSGTGWAVKSVLRPAGNGSLDIDSLYGKSGETYAPLRILITDDIADGYHDISDSSDVWNTLTNPALPVSAGAAESDGGRYVLYYKIVLANYGEFVTAEGRRLSAEECRYNVKINARRISLGAAGGDGITVSEDELSWESGAADKIKITVAGWLPCGGDIAFRYKFLPFGEGDEEERLSNYPEFSAESENGELLLIVPGFVDSGNFILYIYMDNYKYLKDKSTGVVMPKNENFTLEGEECEEGGVKVFKVHVISDGSGENEIQKNKPLAAQTENDGFTGVAEIFSVLAALAIAAASTFVAAFYVKHR